MGTHLIGATELEITVEVLLIESLQAGIKQSAEQRTRHLLYDLCTGLLRVVFSDKRGEFIVIHIVFLRQLVGGSDDEFEFLSGDANGGQDSSGEMGVVFYTMLDELDRGFEIIEERMDIYVSGRVIICSFGEFLSLNVPANSTVTCR